MGILAPLGRSTASHGARNLLPALLLGALRVGVAATSEEVRLALHLLEVSETGVVERPFVERPLDGATRLARVPAVAEATARRQSRDLVERALDALPRVPELELAHSRRVE